MTVDTTPVAPAGKSERSMLRASLVIVFAVGASARISSAEQQKAWSLAQHHIPTQEVLAAGQVERVSGKRAAGTESTIVLDVTLADPIPLKRWPLDRCDRRDLRQVTGVRFLIDLRQRAVVAVSPMDGTAACIEA